VAALEVFGHKPQDLERTLEALKARAADMEDLRAARAVLDEDD